jgi:serine/threonine-protein kinase
MQYDLDQFLSQYEFTPSNIHLSNFLKQLFNDELEEEKDRLGRARQLAAGPEEIIEEAEEIVSVVESISELGDMDPQLTPRKGGPERSLAIQLSGGDIDALNALARKHGVSVNSLLRELVGNFLKYR